MQALDGWLAAAARFDRDVGVAPCDASIDDLCQRFEGAAIDFQAVCDRERDLLQKQQSFSLEKVETAIDVEWYLAVGKLQKALRGNPVTA